MIQSTGSFDVIEIRAHHLLCMQGFQGYGYSQEFERNMADIINYLEKHPFFTLKVVAGVDAICQSCPHLKDGNCGKPDSSAIGNMDLKVLEKLGIEEGETKTAKEILNEVKETLNYKDLQEICGGCSWKDKCLFFINLSEKTPYCSVGDESDPSV